MLQKVSSSLVSLSPLREAGAPPSKVEEPVLPQETVFLSQPKESGRGWRKAALAAAAVASTAGLFAHPAAAAASQATVKVLTLNTWLDCKEGPEKIADVIRRSQADIVGLQETRECTEKLGKELGFSWIQQGDFTGMLSRFPIEEVSPNRHGMKVRLENGEPLAVFNLHLYHAPYQPYQLLGIPYGDFPFVQTEAEAIEQARQARGKDVQSALADIQWMRQQNLPMVLTGDFNEPSHLDWTQRAQESGRHPLKVEWPASKTFAEDGWKDSFRVLHPDEMTHPGFTWTPRTADDDPKDHHDRLDFVMYQGSGIEPVKVQIVGEVGPRSDIQLVDYPTDHRGVVAELRLTPSVTAGGTSPDGPTR